MKYYYDARSGSCRRVSTVIAQLNLQVEEIFVDLLGGGNKTPDFLQINPNGMVPALVDGDIILWEASAIMIYLCEKADDQSLWPKGPVKYDVLRWMFWAAEHFRQPAPIYFEENVIAGMVGNKPDTSRLDEANLRLERFTPILEQHLANRAFVCGDKPTLADIDLAAALSQMPRSGVPYHNYPNIIAWNARLEDSIAPWRTTGQQLDDEMTVYLRSAA